MRGDYAMETHVGMGQNERISSPQVLPTFEMNAKETDADPPTLRG